MVVYIFIYAIYRTHIIVHICCIGECGQGQSGHGVGEQKGMYRSIICTIQVYHYSYIHMYICTLLVHCLLLLMLYTAYTYVYI